MPSRFLLSALWLVAASSSKAKDLAPPLPLAPPQPAFARVAYTPMPPWSFKDDKGQYKGIVVDFMRDLSQDIGLPLREEDLPIARLHHTLTQGKLDIFVARGSDRAFACCVLVGKAFDSETVVMGRKSGPAWGAQGKEGQRICRTGLSGYTVPGYSTFDADSLDTCVRMVSRDRLPFLIGERHSLMQILGRQSPEVIALFAAPQVVEKKEFQLYITRSLDQSSFGPLLRKALLQRKVTDYVARYSDRKL